MNIDNTDPEYVRDVENAINAITCPSCGHAASYAGIGATPASGYYMIPVFACDTEGCEFNVSSDAAWIPALTS